MLFAAGERRNRKKQREHKYQWQFALHSASLENSISFTGEAGRAGVRPSLSSPAGASYFNLGSDGSLGEPLGAASKVCADFTNACGFALSSWRTLGFACRY